jgi:hypothetical protein
MAKEELKDTVTSIEEELVNFLQDRQVRIVPIAKRSPFKNFSLEELDPTTGKYETRKNLPEQFNNTFKYISIPLDRDTGRIKRILDNSRRVKTVQYPFISMTEQEFFETELGLQKGDLDPLKSYTTDDGSIKNRSYWSTQPASLKLDNSPTDLNLKTATGMLKYKVALANSKTLIAPSFEDIQSNPSYTHVITDVDVELQEKEKVINDKSEALKKFFELTEGKDIKKLNEVHSMFESKWQSSTKWEGTYQSVFSKIEANPTKFLSIIKDPKYITKLLLMKFIKYGEVRATNGVYKTIDDREMGTHSEALKWLEDNENFAIVEKIKNRLEKQL